MASGLHVKASLIALSLAALISEPVLAQLLPAIPKADAAAGKKLDLTFVPGDAVAVVVLQPQRLVNSSLFPPQLLALMGKDQLGFDLHDLAQATIVLEQPNAAQGDQPNFAFVLRFTKPMDIEALAAKLVSQGNDAQIEGKRGRISAGQHNLSCATIDGQTMLVAEEGGLHWALAAKAAESPLRKLLAAADDSPEVQVIVAIEPLRPHFAQASKQVPPQLAALSKLPSLINSVAASAKLTAQNGMQFHITAVTPNEQSAQEAESAIKQLLTDGTAMFLAQVNPPVAAGPSTVDFNSIANNVVNSLQPKHVGNRVEIHADLKSAPAMVGTTVALLLPAVQAAREAAARTVSANNLKQIGLALMNHHAAMKRFPAAAIRDKDGKPLLSWRVALLPYLEGGLDLQRQFHLDEPWDSENNKKLIDKMPVVFKHPKVDQPGVTVYQAVVGPHCAFEGNQGTSVKTFTDGTSKTILVVEAAPEKAVAWTKPDDWEPDMNNPTAGLGKLFNGVFIVLFADGSVKNISESIDPVVFKAMLTRNGGEAILQ
jgi:hypothetical protein